MAADCTAVGKDGLMAACWSTQVYIPAGGGEGGGGRGGHCSMQDTGYYGHRSLPRLSRSRSFDVAGECELGVLVT